MRGGGVPGATATDASRSDERDWRSDADGWFAGGGATEGLRESGICADRWCGGSANAGPVGNLGIFSEAGVELSEGTGLRQDFVRGGCLYPGGRAGTAGLIRG